MLGPNAVLSPPWPLSACFRPRFNMWRAHPALHPPPRPRKRHEPRPNPSAPGAADVTIAAADVTIADRFLFFASGDLSDSANSADAANNAAAHWPAEEAHQQLAALVLGRAESQLFVAFPLDQFVEMARKMARWYSRLGLGLDSRL